MTQVMDLTRINPAFAQKIKELSGQDVNLCYQCGKCTAGCPVSKFVSPTPNQIVRLIQLGQEEETLKSPTIWYCLSCVTCTARCPKQVDVARIMDALRSIICRQPETGKQPKIKLFEKLFLESVQKHGRLYEFGTMMSYNLQSGQPFNDIDLFQPMTAKGKLGFTAAEPKNKKGIDQIFKAAIR